MKKATLILLFALATLTSFGQKIRFTDSTNAWKMYNISFGVGITGSEWASSYQMLNDTGSLVIDSHKYRKIFNSYVREDTVTGKVYIRNYDASISSLDTVDKLLYDYDWVVGDTVRSNYLGWTSTFWVAAIDSTKINSIWYKVWHFESDGIYYNVIEGIGCTNRFDYPVVPYPPFEFSSQLICFSNQGATYPLSNPISSWGELGDIYLNNTTSCHIPPLGINTISANKATVYPNPIDNTTKIAFPNNLSGSLMVLNTIGQVVVNMPFTNKDELLIGDKITAPGLYYYRVTDEQGGKVYSGKLVRQ